MRSSGALDVDVLYTHEAWRGRMRACNVVLALGPGQAAECDSALARLLAARFPEPLAVRHEVCAHRAGALRAGLVNNQQSYTVPVVTEPLVEAAADYCCRGRGASARR